MANIHDCLQRAMDGGELDKTRGREAQSEFDQLVARFEGIMPRAQAEAAAADALREATRTSAVARRHKVIAQAQAMVRLHQMVSQAKDPSRILGLLLEYDDGARAAGFTGESVKSLREALIKSINGGIRDFLTKTGRTMLGNSRDPAMLRNVIRELHGEATGDAVAKELADAVKTQQERMRQLFNAHGGNIGKLDDWGVSHSHNVAKMRKAGIDAWIEAVTPRLAWERIVDFKTGKPFSKDGSAPPPATARAFLEDVWNGITSHGWDDRDPTLSTGGKALYNQRAEHRTLHFKGGSEWLEYNRQFGTADPFSAVIGGLHGIAGDIAQMRVLGPNPRMGLEFARQTAQKRASTLRDPKMEAAVKRRGALAKVMLAHIDGSANVPVSEFWASFFGGVRGVLTSIQLGSAPLSAVTDTVTVKVAAKAVGMNGNHVLARAAKIMADPAARDMLASSGYVADTLADMGAASARYVGDSYAPEIVERLTGLTLRASGLAYWTDAMRLAFQGEFTAMLAASRAKPFDDLHPELRGLFQQRGITPADWDALRAPGTVFNPKPDVAFINPMHWLEHTDMPRAEAEGLSMRLQMLIEEQMEFAVPTASLEGRARMLGETRPGTFEGELLRSSTMYKGFTLSFTLGQIRRWNALPTRQDRLKYAVALGTGLIVMGAVAVQLKELAKGRDPRPMNEAKFWMAALFQGGGLGIFGDFFASETSRAGGGLAETLAGPVVGFASDVINPVASNAMKLVRGEDVNVGRDVANFARYNTPFLSSIWYGRTLYDRGVADQLQRLLDPDAENNWIQQERRRAREYGSETWWDRGSVTPSRTPDLTNIAGEP